MTDNIAIPILRNLQNDPSEIKQGLDHLRSDMNLQFAALKEKLRGQLLSEIEIKKELGELRKRLQRVEKRLEMIDS